MSRKADDAALRTKVPARESPKPQTLASRPQSVRKGQVDGPPGLTPPKEAAAATADATAAATKRRDSAKDSVPKAKAAPREHGAAHRGAREMVTPVVAINRSPPRQRPAPLGSEVPEQQQQQHTPQRQRPAAASPGSPTTDEMYDACVETDSFDEEVELLRCEADLVEAAADIGTTSADDDLVTTDPDVDDDDDVLAGLPSGRPPRCWKAPSAASVVIEEDDEDISSGFDDEPHGFEVDSSEMRSRLWAQSLLRLKRSIDEIHSLCEFESDEGLCEQVRVILETASADFRQLMAQFDTQHEYSLLAGEYPFKSGVAWTTRTPRAPKVAEKVGETALEFLTRAQLQQQHTSPTSSISGRASAKTSKVDSRQRRASSADPRYRNLAPREEAHDTDESLSRSCGAAAGDAITFSESEAKLREEFRQEASNLEELCHQHPPHDHGMGRAKQLDFMVQTALTRVQSRLGRSTGKLSPDELARRNEEKQRRAQTLRQIKEDKRVSELRQLEGRILAARERRQQKEQELERELLEKMTRARRQYQDQLRTICQRARKENRKASEVAYITKESLKGEKEMLHKKHEKAALSRVLMREQMQKKLLESANRVARVAENRRRQEEMRQCKVQQELEEKISQASQRRSEHIRSVRLKNQGQDIKSEMVSKKRREMQEEDELKSNEFLKFKNKHIAQLALNCDGLPDGVREEVTEQLQALVAAATDQRSSGRKRSSVAGPSGRAKAASGGGAAGSSGGTSAAERPSTPTRTGAVANSASPKGSPASAKGWVNEASDSAELQELAVASPFDSPRRGDSGEPAVVEPSARSDPEERKHNKNPAKKPGTAAGGAGATRTAPAAAEARSKAAGAGPAASAKSAAPAPRGKQAAATPVDASAGTAAAPAAAAPLATTDVAAGEQKADQSPSHGAGPQESGSEDEAAASDAGKEDHGDAAYREDLRRQLATRALSDDEAIKLACDSDSHRAVNAAHRARISKLATDLGKALGNSNSSTTLDEQVVQQLNLERVDTVLTQFCQVLNQSQCEADFMLVCKVGAAGHVIDVCSRLRASVCVPTSCAERDMPHSCRQMRNVTLSALKWLGLLSKHKVSRMFCLLTNRILPLADLAVACLDAHFHAEAPAADAQSVSILFLPQLLHVLSLHVRQGLPDAVASLRRLLISYFLVSKLSGKLRDFFQQAEIRGLKLFDGASPVPLFLLRSMGFLGTLVNAYRVPADREPTDTAPVLHMMRRTELFGIVSVLVSILLSGGPLEKQASAQAQKLPQTVISICLQSVRILNNVARIDLSTLQDLGTCRHEFYHLLSCLFEYCAARLHNSKAAGQDENELLHELLALIGYYCLLQEENQRIMAYGEGQSLLMKITSLPLHYFMDENDRFLLFPTILAACFRSDTNLELLRNEMNLSLLQNFLTGLLAKDSRALPEMARDGFGGRFPVSLWREALGFFSEEAA